MGSFRRVGNLIGNAFSYKTKLIRPLGLPCHFVIEATNYCNFRCAFCPQSNPDHKNVRKYGFLSQDGFRFFIKRLLDANICSKFISIGLDGEQLLNKYFVEFVKITNQAGFIAQVPSNGKLLTPDYLDKLLGCNFMASIDFTSDKALFEKVRGGVGDFDVVLANLRNVMDHARMDNKIRLDIADISTFAGKDAAVSLGELKGLFGKKFPSNVKFRSRKFHNFGGHLKGKFSGKRYHLCPYPWVSFVTNWEGNVVACCRDTEAKTILGNIFENSIEEIWQGTKYRDFRHALINRRPQDVAACANCDMPWRDDGDRWNIGYMVSRLFQR